MEEESQSTGNKRPPGTTFGGEENKRRLLGSGAKSKLQGDWKGVGGRGGGGQLGGSCLVGGGLELMKYMVRER